MPRKKLSTHFTLKGNWRPGAYTPFSEILPHLLQGDCDGVQDSKFLRKHRISHVVTMGFVGPPEEVVAAQDLRVCEIDVKDSAGARVDKHFDEAVRFVHEGRSANGTLYVHCYSGVSGSSAIVAAYLMVWLNVSYADAILYVRSCRPCADPNPSFKKQLKNFGNETEKLAALRDQLMKMGPATKRDQRLEDDKKRFNDAIEALTAKDAASDVPRVSGVDNGVLPPLVEKNETPIAEKDIAEEKDIALSAAEEEPPEAAAAAAATAVDAAAADNGEPEGSVQTEQAAEAEEQTQADSGQDAEGDSGQDVGADSGKNAEGNSEENVNGGADAQEAPSHERVEGNLEEVGS